MWPKGEESSLAGIAEWVSKWQLIDWCGTKGQGRQGVFQVAVSKFIFLRQLKRNFDVKCENLIFTLPATGEGFHNPPPPTPPPSQCETFFVIS